VAGNRFIKALYLCRNFGNILDFTEKKIKNVDLSNQKFVRLFAMLTFSSFSTSTFAQASGGNSLLVASLFVIAAFVLIWMIIRVADNLLHIEGKNQQVDHRGISLLPKLGELFQPRLPESIVNSGDPFHILKQGYDIPLEGVAPSNHNPEIAEVSRFALQPKNFIGMSPIPKLMVEVGDEVKAGQPLFYDKLQPEVLYVSPVSGEFIELKRAEKRSIAEIVILADKDQKYVELNAPGLEYADTEEIRAFLKANGGWSLIRQRPFHVVPSSDDVPENIFISTFDTSPMAPDLNVVVSGNEAAFQKGLDVLGKLTEGDVYLGLDGRGPSLPAETFQGASGVKKHWFIGKHPAGNVGIQIHHIKPLKAGSKVWTLDVQDVITIGNMWVQNKFVADRMVALNGAELNKPKIVQTKIGANIGELLKGNIKEGDQRIISGDILSGQQKNADNFLNIGDTQISVIKEGHYLEPFGWLIPTVPKPSISKSFPSILNPDKYEVDTNTHGERRAFVVTGQYEEVLPVDTYPQALLKAILNNDFETMEGLGLHELVEEDVALCEFVCTSKMPVQKILRDGLDMMRAQS
jgi:Na+-transporting NADH:ubiquinone oxidoreductase subunit A